MYFNPRARVGHDVAVAQRGGDVVFQSTCPRGARLDMLSAEPAILISIHVPAWGTTSGSRATSGPRTISIHVPAWGTTVKPAG